MNSFAEAWLEAAQDLKIRVQHPFSLVTTKGKTVMTQGVYLPDFGSKKGTLLTCRFDSDEVADFVYESDYYSSSLNPHHYEPYSREHYMETLDDWGWFDDKSKKPDWYTGDYYGATNT